MKTMEGAPTPPPQRAFGPAGARSNGAMEEFYTAFDLWAAQAPRLWRGIGVFLLTKLLVTKL